MRLPPFRPMRQGFCTCLPKYSLNTYVGRCAHQCIYCYAVKFPSFVGDLKPRLKLLEEIENMAENTKPKLPVMISDCTDPYQPLEKHYGITRKCTEVLVKQGFPILIVTKSDMVARDIDLFKKTPTVVSVSVTTLRDDIAELIDPHAPPPERRLSALQNVASHDLPPVARIDPIIPTINDDEKDLKSLVTELSDVGVKQVTVATMKPVKGFFQNMEYLNSKICRNLAKIYECGEYVMGYRYLSRDLRWKILHKLYVMVRKQGMEFACCREGFTQLNTALCDGTRYCREQFETKF